MDENIIIAFINWYNDNYDNSYDSGIDINKAKEFMSDYKKVILKEQKK